MSVWTNVIGTIEVDAGIDCENRLTKFIDSLPQIKGSEGKVEFYVNKLNGYNYFISCDCDKCQYKDTIQYNEEWFSCESPYDFKCPKGEYQTVCLVSIFGDLRDTHVSSINEKVLEILKLFNKHFYIDNCVVKLSDGMNSVVYTNGDLDG